MLFFSFPLLSLSAGLVYWGGGGGGGGVGEWVGPAWSFLQGWRRRKRREGGGYVCMCVASMDWVFGEWGCVTVDICWLVFFGNRGGMVLVSGKCRRWYDSTAVAKKWIRTRTVLLIFLILRRCYLVIISLRPHRRRRLSIYSSGQVTPPIVNAPRHMHKLHAKKETLRFWRPSYTELGDVFWFTDSTSIGLGRIWVEREEERDKGGSVPPPPQALFFRRIAPSDIPKDTEWFAA